MFSFLSRIVLIFLLVVVAAPVASAQTDVSGFGGAAPKRTRYPIAIPMATEGDSSVAKEVFSVASFDLNVSGWFKVLDPKGFLANLQQEGMDIRQESWKNIGAFGVIKFRVKSSGSRVNIEFRLYEIEKGETPVLTRVYQGDKSDVRGLTHRFCNEVVKHFTGEDGFFGSKILFVSKSQQSKNKAVFRMDFDGQGVTAISRNRSINILPAWSVDGSRIAYTSYMRDNPDLYVVGAGGGRPTRISKHRGMNTGASFSPDGSQIALTLSKDGNPEIYIIAAADGRIIKRLTNNRHIDTSPAWSPDGSEIAFVSDREGGPQIFVMSANGGNPRRVSMNGSYNTTPTWSPVRGERRIAYTTRAEKTFDIVTLDLNTKEMVRITQNEGVNEEPSFAPNGRVIAFSSSRPGGSGIYLANADGSGNAIRVFKGSVTSIDWGPAPKQ